MERCIDSIVIHCSDSEFGSVDLIDEWHKKMGWNGVGYHFVITNGVLSSNDEYSSLNDGLVQKGRDLNIPGAHCKGHNKTSIGICLIGKKKFTAKQLYLSLPVLLSRLMFNHGIGIEKVYGHSEFSKHKTCPNVSKEIIRKIAEYSV